MLAEHIKEQDENGQLNLNSSLRDIAYWESSLFSPVYLRNDLKRDFADHWERDYEDQVFDENGDNVKSGFYHFYKEFRDIAKRLRSVGKSNISETDTINKIIVPILDALGWYDNCYARGEEPFPGETSFTIKENGKKKTYRTDLILVDHPTEADFINNHEDPEKRKREARQYCIAPLEAKYWNRIPDREKSKTREVSKRADVDNDDTNASVSFNEQVLKYMDILHKRWGIVTDGNTWRLVNSQISGEHPTRCFEFKLESLLEQESKIEAADNDDAEFLENAKYFYLFFGKPSYVPDETGKVFLDEALKESRKYIDNIEEDLKDRFISAMNYTCDGLLKAAKQKGKIQRPSQADLKLIRTVAESHLFNILFIKSCEAKGILPIKSPDYYKMSLTSIIDRISVFDPKNYATSSGKGYIDMRLSKSLKIFGYKPNNTGIYKNLLKLTGVIHSGAKKSDNFGFEIEGFKESVFSKEEWGFAKAHPLSDEDMVKILFELGYSKATLSIQKNYQQIPYNYFTPRQLGSIYESFLEYKLDVAKEPMAYIQKGKYKQWVKLTASVQRKLKGHEPIAKKGSLFFTPDNSDRKASGSYYTPDNIVNFMVKDTIGSLPENITSKDVLKLRVCDPAMGSGHFLIGMLNHLTDLYISRLEDEVSNDNLPSKEEAKRIVLDKCIFGADINPRTVKLAKMSLWLESAYSGRKLERLDDQLFAIDFFESDASPLADIAFDAFIGNPPYINTFILSKMAGYKDFLKSKLSSAKGNFDICSLFIEMCNSLSDSAKISFIVPNKMLNSGSSKGLISFLEKQSNLSLKSVDDLSNLNIFEDASVYPVIVQYVPNSKCKTKVRKHPEHFDISAEYSISEHSLSMSEVSEVINSHETSYEGMPLDDVASVNATATVDEAYKVVKPSLKDGGISGQKFIVSRNILSFGQTWSLEPVSYLKIRYNAPNFVASNPTAKKKAKQYSVPKVIIPNMTKNLRAFYDERGVFAPAISMTMITDSEISLKALASFLNSTVATKTYSGMFKNLHLNGGALRIGAPQLRELAVPKQLFNSKANIKKAERFHDEISKEVNSLLDRGVKPSHIKAAFDDLKSKRPELGKLIELKVEMDSFFESLVSSSSLLKAA